MSVIAIAPLADLSANSVWQTIERPGALEAYFLIE